MPVVHPADLWKESRAAGIDRLRDGRASSTRDGRDMVLAMTHEEVVADLVRRRDRLLPAVAAPGLPDPDQVARRPAPARRA